MNNKIYALGYLFIVLISSMFLFGCGGNGESLEERIANEKMAAKNLLAITYDVEDNIVEKQGLFKKRLKKRGQKVKGRLKNKAVWITYRNVELDMVFSNKENREIGRRRFMVKGEIEPFQSLKFEHKIVDSPKATKFVGVQYAKSKFETDSKSY